MLPEVPCATTIDFLDCTGGAFAAQEPRWEALYEAGRLHHERSLRFENLRDAEALFSLATALAERWLPTCHTYVSVADKVLKRLLPPSELGGFCLYGLVTALFLRAQHFSEILRQPVDALAELQMALNLLGERLHLDFALEASRWPFDHLDVKANRDLLLEGLSKLERALPGEGQEGAETTKAPPAQAAGRDQGAGGDAWPLLRFELSAARSRGSPPPVVPVISPWSATAAPQAPPVASTHHRLDLARHMTVAVFGVHSTLVLEPATMLRTALLPNRLSIRIYMRDCPKGNEVWSHHCLLQCRVLGDCGASDLGGRLFVELVHMFEDAIFARLEYYPVADYMQLLVQMYKVDPVMQAAAFYVCTAPLVCSLLHAALDKPLMSYFGMQLHVARDRQKDQLWLMHFRATALDSCRCVFAVHNFAMREQMHYATGIRLQVVRPRTLYAHVAVQRWRLPQAHFERFHRQPLWRRQVLIYRSSYFKLSLFLPLLETYLLGCRGRFPLQLRAVTNSSDFIGFAALRRYRAAVLFPWDPALMAFYELYSLAGPVVFVPRRDWAFKIQQFSGWIWSDPTGAVSLAGLDMLNGSGAARGRPNYEFSPWWQPEDSTPSQALYWYANSDYERLPHLSVFGSLAELFQGLLQASRLRKARAGMRRHNRRALHAGIRWYRGAVWWLLKGSRNERACTHLRS